MPVRILYIVFLLSFFISGCSGSDATLRRYGFLFFKVSIEQDGLIKEAEKGEVVLERKPFTIKVTFVENDRVFVNASYSSLSHDTSLQGRPIAEIMGFNDAAIPEEPYNKNEELFISAKAPNYWFYTSDSEHRFSSVTKSGKLLICERKIVRIHDLDSNEVIDDFSKLKADAVYLVFMQIEWSEDFSSKIENKRDFLKIVFAGKK